MGNGRSRLTSLYTQTATASDESRPDMFQLLIDESKLRYEYVISYSVNTTVYAGTYMDKPVAIKVIQKEKGTNVSPSRKEKFLREVRLLAAAKNDNIVKFIGFSLEPAMTLVTEIMKGGSLQKHLWNIRPSTLDRKEALVMALEISRAMAYLHENGIIHRDLNPNNIFLSESKKSVKLGDFGLCREGLEGDFSADVGSFRWMAPEVYSREQHGITRLTTRYNHKVDVYSFAIVLWELLTNKTPFQGKDNNAIAQAVINNQRPRLNEDELPEYIVFLMEPSFDTLEPSFNASDQTALVSATVPTITLFSTTITVPTCLDNCYDSILLCCDYIHPNLCCCCPSCETIQTGLCGCCPSCETIQTRLCCCCPSCETIQTRLCCCCPSCDSICKILCCFCHNWYDIQEILCCCCPSRDSIQITLASCCPTCECIQTRLNTCYESIENICCCCPTWDCVYTLLTCWWPTRDCILEWMGSFFARCDSIFIKLGSCLGLSGTEEDRTAEPNRARLRQD